MPAGAQAPELLVDQGGDSVAEAKAADMYAVAMILWQLWFKVRCHPSKMLFFARVALRHVPSFRWCEKLILRVLRRRRCLSTV